MDPLNEQLHRAQFRYDNMDDTDDAESEDDLTMLDIREEEAEEEAFWRKNG